MKKSIILLMAFYFGLLVNVVAQPKVRSVFSTELNTGWHFKETGTSTWKIAAVPGCVQSDLINNGIIEDPFINNNVENVQWVETKDWEYETKLPVTNEMFVYEHIELNFEGLDTYADVFVNDQLVLNADNMFVGWNVDIRKYLKPIEDNKLRILFHSPVNHDMEVATKSGIKYPAENEISSIKTSPFTRKAAYQYGWDFAPRLVTSGIWRPVQLIAWNGARIRESYFKTISISKEQAQIEANLEIESDFQGDAQIIIKDADNNFKPVRLFIPMMRKNYSLKIPFNIKNPELWYPSGMGKQPLYHLAVELICDSVMDEVKQNLGLRTIEVVNKKDVTGQSFYLKVNGIPLYSKGANCVPLNSFPAVVTNDNYDQLFDDMISSNFNCVRVWGGGIYESDYFYNRADEKGILVWQDFMFACTMYPSDSVFMRRVGQEAEYNIKRLRSHTCLALWCGNNEIDVAWKNWGWQQSFNYSNDDSLELIKGYQKLFKDNLYEAVNRYDSGRFYFHSSPISNWGRKSDFSNGDNHFWGVWHGDMPFESYRNYVPRFMSEFGFQSYPAINTLKAITENNFVDSIAAYHQKARNGNTRISKYMNWYYNEPENFEHWIYVSQLLQADAMKIGIESQRKAKPFCMGSLVWQMNDCWPAVSWSTTDFMGSHKAAYYAVKKSFNETLIITEVINDSLYVSIVSDAADSKKTNLSLKLLDFYGATLWNEKIALSIPSRNDKSLLCYTISLADLLKGRSRNSVVFKASIDKRLEDVSTSICYFDTLKNIQFPKLAINYEINKTGDKFVVKLSTDTLAKNVFMFIDDDATSNFDDNYFDMLPGTERKIEFNSVFNLKEVMQKFRVITLADTY